MLINVFQYHKSYDTGSFIQLEKVIIIILYMYA